MHPARLDGLPDLEVLRLAAHEGRILVSGNHSPGIMIVPDKPNGPVIESILLLWIASEADECGHSIGANSVGMLYKSPAETAREVSICSTKS